MNKPITLGVLAHVDAGKTTLSEALLFSSGRTRRFGRVDHGDAYLDTFELEKARGITIFSKQATFSLPPYEVTLLDTPGHVDFSAEMERTLQVLDYAILVISGPDGVQGHTKTLWRLLDFYQIPTFIFVNKMDQSGTDRTKLLQHIKRELSEGCIQLGEENALEQVALTDEHLMDTYLDSGMIAPMLIREAIVTRKVFPVYFGAALRLEGVDKLMSGLSEWIKAPSYVEKFSARIFKITRDDQNNRLTHLKVTGGVLKVKEVFETGDVPEKVNQIRLYSGVKFESTSEVPAGTICTVTGLNHTKPGMVYGEDENITEPILEPVLSYQILLPEGDDPRVVIPKLRLIEEEFPELQFTWHEVHQEIIAQLMGEVQKEVLQTLAWERFGLKLEFGDGSIVYKETIDNIVEGVGHFEPLRHYAEVHVLLTPGEQGSGLVFESDVSEDLLSKNWQRLVLSHLAEKPHLGVLTGSPITDMKITLVAGRAHIKHTEGGDFREATFRAVRAGLMEAQSRVLEPYYAFTLELPERLIGRAMTDVEQRFGSCEIVNTDGKVATLKGTAPVATFRNYQMEVVAYSKGEGRLFMSFGGYGPCHNSDEVIQRIGYQPDADFENPTWSVFCTGGTGFAVPWYEVKQHMHVEGVLKVSKQEAFVGSNTTLTSTTTVLSLEEIDAIIQSTSFSNQGKKSDWKKSKPARQTYYETSHFVAKPVETLTEYLLVDGYNIIFAWPELKALSEHLLESARLKLLDLLSNYAVIKKCEVIVVFDAYRVAGRNASVERYHNIDVVFTGEAQTADHYIEKFAHQNRSKYRISVATSDGLSQMIIRGAGAGLMSARELLLQLESANNEIQIMLDNTKSTGTQITQTLLTSEQIEIIRRRMTK